ncbi:GNAT family N-acetyltransferase [Arthrobacter sp. H5]|uniref:GNAT family N-acetyltransferase n=1 Tax=Arthrobacter sp. H5 TaxID=1267973 RepID=UPI000489C6EF|nr:GNAT family N-acetyltransferase [Arthrobacter sp. H5]
MNTLQELWPLFGLRIVTPRLELTPIRDEQLPEMVDAILTGIHDPLVMPFSVPWTDAPRETLIREAIKHQWRQRCTVEPDNWTISFAVCCEGRVIGMQDMSARSFSLMREVHTGSWLTRSMHGQGLGREMRAAVLMFAFDHLEARTALSEAADWNGASLGVSRSLGYSDNGVSNAESRPGVVTRQQHVRLEAADFIRPDFSLAVHGFDRAEALLLPA